MVIPESTRPALATTGLLSQRKTSQNPFLLLSLSSQNISETLPKPPMSSLTALFLQVLPPPSVHRPSSGKTTLYLSYTHSPIPPSASMASSNHLHGQPCPWPVVYAALVTPATFITLWICQFNHTWVNLLNELGRVSPMVHLFDGLMD